MTTPKRPSNFGPAAELLRLWVEVGDRKLTLKLVGRSGLHLPRDGVGYYESIGRWLCDEIEAPALADQEATR
jgi:hypothetical protein